MQLWDDECRGTKRLAVKRRCLGAKERHSILCRCPWSSVDLERQCRDVEIDSACQ